MKLFNITTKSLFALLTLLIITVSCDNPASTDHHHHEEEFVGLKLFMNGKEIAHYHEGHVHGEIVAHVTQETSLITVKFIAGDGDLLQPHEAGHFLGWEVADNSIATIEQHADDGTWKFHVIGKKEGKTTVKLKLMHGSEESAHPHLVTKPIAIRVLNQTDNQ